MPAQACTGHKSSVCLCVHCPSHRLNLALHEIDGAPFCIFDEIDAALDTQRVHALAQHVRSRASSQTLFISHRKEVRHAAQLI